MKSRGAAGDMFKSTGGGGIASQSVVELPPISKNGLILEDADDVDYSVSAKGGSRRGKKPFVHSNSADTLKSAPRISASSNRSRLVSSSWNAIRQNSARAKPQNRQIRTVEALPVDKKKSSSSAIDSGHTGYTKTTTRPSSFKTQVSEPTSQPKQPLSQNVPVKVSLQSATLSAEKSSTSLRGSSDKDPTSAKSESLTQSTADKHEAKNKGASDSSRCEQVMPHNSKPKSVSSLTHFKRAKTAARRKKENQSEDFVIEMFLKDKPPTTTVIDEAFTQDHLLTIKTEAQKDQPLDNQSSNPISNTTVLNDCSGATQTCTSVPEDNTSHFSPGDEDSEGILPNGSKTTEEVNKEQGKSDGEEVVTVAVPPVVVDRSASRYHEDVLAPPEDVFVTGCNIRSPKFEATPISVQEAISLKKAVFGDTHAVWSKSWLNHCLAMSSSFSLDLCNFGPSGLLAALQAHYLHQHFFTHEKDESSVWKPTQAQKRANLVRAMAALLWKCGSDNSLACFCNITSHVQYSPCSAMPHDGITERIEIFRFSSENEVSQFMSEFSSQILSCKCALLSLLYSVVLSRSPYSIRQDLLNQEEPLLVNHRCAPALISLLLTGVAAPSWMNDNSDLRLDPRLRRGIHSRSNFGVLTTRETPRNSNSPYSVESNLKTPKFPIWVVEIPSGDIYSGQRTWQYSVVFCPNKRLVSDWKVERHFDLYWTQACPYQVEKVKLTLDARAVVNWDEVAEEDFHWIETAIRTKWIDLDVDWNGLDRSDFGFVQPSETAVQLFKK